MFPGEYYNQLRDKAQIAVNGLPRIKKRNFISEISKETMKHLASVLAYDTHNARFVARDNEIFNKSSEEKEMKNTLAAHELGVAKEYFELLFQMET